MYKQVEQTLVSAGTYDNKSTGTDLDRISGAQGLRNLRVALGVSAVAGASPSVTINVRATLEGSDVTIFTLTAPLTAIGIVSEVFASAPQNCWLEIVASGTITASSLSFKAYAEAV